jgi:uncharacterized protein (DUF1015 family)
MAEIVPFIGTRYDTKVVNGLGEAICPPYDVITPEMQNALYNRSRHNFVRLELGKELTTDDEYNNRYDRAAHCFQEWKRESVLLDELDPSFYVLEQEYEAGGRAYRRRGFFAAVRIEEGPASRIRAHEHTFPGPKADRLKLLRATQCNLSPVFVLCSDPQRKIVNFLTERATAAPTEEFVDTEGVKSRLWVVSAAPDIAVLQEATREESLLIADGHHRYETALAFRDEMRKALGRHKNLPFDYVMMYVTSIEDDGLIILPTHRALRSDLGADTDLNEVLGDLEQYFELERLQVNFDQPKESARQLLDRIVPNHTHQFRAAMVLPDRQGIILTLKGDVNLEEVMVAEDLAPAIRSLDVSILHQFIINQIWIGNPEMELEEEDVIYSRDAAVILERLKRRHACVGFLVNATRIDQVQEVASAGLRMPHKSTFFYPKIPSGIVARDFSRSK